METAGVNAVLQSLYSGLPVLLTHFGITLLVFLSASAIYLRITPHNELTLIREGSIPAAISLGGALLGLALPLGFCLAGSVNIYDIAIWGVVILSLQLFTYFVIDRMMGGISKRILAGELAPVIFLVAVKLSVAVLNAAAIAG
jgi:putative membrane protein